MNKHHPEISAGHYYKRGLKKDPADLAVVKTAVRVQLASQTNTAEQGKAK